MKINENVLKINGRRKIYLEKGLEMDKNYKFEVSGSLNTISQVSNEDGTVDIIHNFDPMIVEPKGELGESMKAQDIRQQSQKFRAVLKQVYETRVVDYAEIEFDTYYGKVYHELYKYIDPITSKIIQENKNM